MQALFRTLAFPVNHVIVNKKETNFSFPPELYANAQKFWQEFVKPGMYNGKLARLSAWTIKSDTLELELGVTDYCTQVYCNHHLETVLQNWGENSLSYALGISAVVETQDNDILLMKRSRYLGEYPGFVDVFGGHIEIAADKSMPPSIDDAMLTELNEELGIEKQLLRIEPLGLVESLPNRKPELVFFCQLNVSTKQVMDCVQHAQDRHEYTHILTVKGPEALKEHRDHPDTSPSAVGSLSLFLEKKRQEG